MEIRVSKIYICTYEQSLTYVFSMNMNIFICNCLSKYIIRTFVPQLYNGLTFLDFHDCSFDHPITLIM